MRWPLVFYTDALQEWQAGCANGPVIRIRPAYKGDEGLYQHELTHVKQWVLTLGMHPLLYLTVRRYRQWAEATAYREQMRYPDAKGGSLSLDNAAARLAGPGYSLGITVEHARNILQHS